VLLEDLIDLFWPKNEILEENVSAEEAHVKLLLIKAEEEFAELVFQALEQSSFKHHSI